MNSMTGWSQSLHGSVHMQTISGTSNCTYVYTVTSCDYDLCGSIGCLVEWVERLIHITLHVLVGQSADSHLYWHYLLVTMLSRLFQRVVKNYSGDGTVGCINHWLDFEETRLCSCPKMVGICGWKNGHFECFCFYV